MSTANVYTISMGVMRHSINILINKKKKKRLNVNINKMVFGFSMN